MTDKILEFTNKNHLKPKGGKDKLMADLKTIERLSTELWRQDERNLDDIIDLLSYYKQLQD